MLANARRLPCPSLPCLHPFPKAPPGLLPLQEITKADFPLPSLGPKLEAFLKNVVHGLGFQLIRGETDWGPGEGSKRLIGVVVEGPSLALTVSTAGLPVAPSPPPCCPQVLHRTGHTDCPCSSSALQASPLTSCPGRRR